jgi:hypothetical protein
VFGDLQQALDSQLAAKGAVLTVRLDQWPLDVSGRNLLHTRVSGAAAAAVAAGASETAGPGVSSSSTPASRRPAATWPARSPPWRGRSTWTRPSRAGLALDLIAISGVIAANAGYSNTRPVRKLAIEVTVDL